MDRETMMKALYETFYLYTKMLKWMLLILSSLALFLLLITAGIELLKVFPPYIGMVFLLLCMLSVLFVFTFCLMYQKHRKD